MGVRVPLGWPPTQIKGAIYVADKPLSSKETIDLFQRYVIPNYGRFPVSLVRGEGSYVWDSEGNRYLDLFPGWGCNMLGHCPAPVVEAVRDQLGKLMHVPNTWYTDLQGLWAKALSQRSFGGQAFFCNSGTEANEAAIKLTRLHSQKPRYKIITFEGGFHGRTLGSTSATAQPKYHEGLGPLMAGFVYAPFGDLDAVAKLIDDETAALMIEPIQGEGGVRIPPDGFPGRPAQTGRPARPVVDLRRSAIRLRTHGRVVRLSTLRGYARRHDPVEGPLRRNRRGGHAHHRRDRQKPAARHACMHLRRQSYRRPGRTGRHPNDRARKTPRPGKAPRRSVPLAFDDLRQKCDLIREVRVQGVMVGVELAIEAQPR